MEVKWRVYSLPHFFLGIIIDIVIGFLSFIISATYNYWRDFEYFKFIFLVIFDW